MDKPWKVIAAFIGVFIAGAVFGGFFALGFGSHLSASPTPVATVATAPATAEPAAAPASATATVPAEPKVAAAPTVTVNPAPKPQQPRPPLLQVPFAWQEPQLMRRYADRLDLTAEQKNKINPVIQRALEDYRRLQQTQFRETGIIVQRMQSDIRKELTPDQITELDKMEQRQREIVEKAEARQKAEQQKKADFQKKKSPGAQKPAGERKQPKSAPAPSAPATSPENSTSASTPSSPSSVTSTETTSAVVTPTK